MRFHKGWREKYLTLLALLACVAGAAAAQDSALHVAHVNGIELHWMSQGSGVPLILLHGGQGDYRSWGPQVEALSPHFRVITYSQRYHFPNHNVLRAADHSARVEAADLYALITALNLGRVHLVGTSMGAAAALTFAVSHPDLVRSLVLAEPPVHAWVRDSAPISALYESFMRDVHAPAARAFKAGHDTAAMRAFVDGFAARALFDSLPGPARLAIMQNANAMKAIALSEDPYPTLDKEAVRRLPMPVLVVRGENTVRIHQQVNAILSGLLPHAVQATIPHAGHGSPRENPSAFNAAVLSFLSTVRD